MQARWSPLINMFAWVGERQYRDLSFEKRVYPLQISVDHAKVVHILQAFCNVNQLNIKLIRLLWDQAITYKFSTVHTPVSLDELVDVSIFHPLGDQSEPVFTHCHAKER